MTPEHILNRTGARNTASVPGDVLKLLNSGKIESVNLCEWLVIDQLALAEVVFKKLGWAAAPPCPQKAFQRGGTRHSSEKDRGDW